MEPDTDQIISQAVRAARVRHEDIAARAGVTRPYVTMQLTGQRRLRPAVRMASLEILREAAQIVPVIASLVSVAVETERIAAENPTEN